MSSSGKLYTFGDKEKGKLGRPHIVNAPQEVPKFVASDEQTEIQNVKIGQVSGIMYLY